MGTRNRRSVVLVVALAAALVLSGCIGTTTQTTESPTITAESPVTDTTDVATDTDSSSDLTETTPSGAGDIADQFERRLSSLDSYTATMTVRATFGGNETTTTRRIWARPETGEVRREVVASSYGQNGTVTVFNESTMVTYQPDTNEVRRIDRSDAQQGSTGMGTTMVGSLVDQVSVEPIGTVQLDGETARKVRLIPESSMSSQEANITAWLDEETYFPVRIETAGTGSVNFSSVVTYENVELNPDIPDSRFRLDTPADASVSDYSVPETRSYDSVSALRENVSMSVPDPDLPAEYTFQGARVTRTDLTSVSLRYRNESGMISVSKTNDTTYDGSEDSETVRIGNRTVAVTELGSGVIVRWSCDGETYSISGSVSESAMLDVAASVECG